MKKEMMKITAEQAETIELLTIDAKENKDIIALILCGSLVKGTSTEHSDVDVFVMVTDEEFEKRKANKDYFCGTLFDQSKYPAPVDGKVVNKEYISRIWVDGNESVKGNFLQIKILFSHDLEVTDILNNADKTNYDKAENIKKFYALMKSNRFKADDDMNNIMQVKFCIFNTVFFACRLALAHNDIYYPCIKLIEKELAKCKELPDNFIAQMRRVLETYSIDELEKFYDLTEEYFKQYRFDDKIRKGYVIENEDFWFFKIRPYDEI